MKRDREYERMLLPYDPPLPPCIGGRLPSIPCLWERARMMFGRVLTHIGSTASLAQCWRLTRTEKKDVLGWLEPVEQLARACLVAKAIAFLLMTPEGRRLMSGTSDPATPPRPRQSNPKPPDPNVVSVVNIPHPGWRTIASHHAAMVLKEKRAAERAADAPAEPAGQEKPSASFRVVRWTPQELDTDQAPPNKPAPCGVIALDPDSLALYLPPREPRSVSASPKQSPAIRLARRIEALGRALARPEEEARRLARFLARLPRAALASIRNIYARSRSWWKHGFEDNRLVVHHIWRAAAILAPDPEPG